ncbi:DMT family transporter [Streptomyces sp. Go40/10]|uniref:DMT family transporter n=1 Tax=Streptomyces sp. Go40/10 TaxID=2825844 RepID=UPI001E34525A|nr:DMT family transporter [Streptomyces sp. Go40/10]UFR00859.1 DMT family transporter [Streptomyces sp. Go40/10]
MSALALSVLLSFVSALAYAGGAIVQEQVAVSGPAGGYLPLRRPGWWGALALNGLGGVLHVVALACGPLSLVQPLGALTIVFALPMAALCVGRRAGATAWRGALMATAGLAGLLSLVGSSSAHSLDPAQRLVVALVTGGAVAALMCAGLAVHRHPAVRSVLLATASGIAFGMSSVFTKTVAVDWTGGIGLGGLSSLAVIGVFAAAGVLLSQASYRGGGLAAPLATLTVVNPVLAAAVGILMFGETFRYGTTGTVLALGCGVVAAGGLLMLTTERMDAAATSDTAVATSDTAATPDTAAPAPATAAPAPATAAPAPASAAPASASAAPAPASATPLRASGAAVVFAAGAFAVPGEPAVAEPSAAPGAAAGAHLGVPRQRGVGHGATGRAGDAGTGAATGAGPAATGAGPAATVLGELLLPAPAGSGAGSVGAPAAGAPAAGALPVSYVPLSASFHVPLPVRDRRRARVTS